MEITTYEDAAKTFKEVLTDPYMTSDVVKDEGVRYCLGYDPDYDEIKVGYRTKDPLRDGCIVVYFTMKQIENFNEKIFNTKLNRLLLAIKNKRMKNKLNSLSKDF